MFRLQKPNAKRFEEFWGRVQVPIQLWIGNITVFLKEFFTESQEEGRRKAWHLRRLGVVLLYIFIFLRVYWFVFLPSPGKAVAALGVAAAFMTLFGEMRGKEKMAWILLLFAYLQLELYSIDKERLDREREQQIAHSEQVKNFTGIARGIETAISNSDKEFRETMRGIRTSVNTITGGDSFCYLDFGSLQNNYSLYMTAVRVGKYPMRGVAARIMDSNRARAAIDALMKTHKPSPDEVFETMRQSEILDYIPDFSTPTRDMGGYPAVAGDQQSFQILFRAFNAEWIERLELRRVRNKWTKAMMVETWWRKGRPFFFKIDSDYPRIDGHLDVPGWPRPTKGKPEWEH